MWQTLLKMNFAVCLMDLLNQLAKHLHITLDLILLKDFWIRRMLIKYAMEVDYAKIHDAE